MKKTELHNRSFIAQDNMSASRTPLTSKETEILRYVANGNTNGQIASILRVNEQTVKNHMTIILLKLNAKDRAHATFLGVRNGLI